MIFEEREEFVFSILKESAGKFEFAVIGGYALNAFTLPRFSIDCDIVVRDKKTLIELIAFLKSKGFAEGAKGSIKGCNGGFVCLACKKPVCTFDVFYGCVEDRMSGIVFPAEFIFKFSSKRVIFGKSAPMQLKALTASAELLFLMKAVSCRLSDIRDVFMLASIKLDKTRLSNLFKLFPVPKENISKIISLASSKDFKNSLQGVFGKIPEEQFERTRKKLVSLLK